MWNKQTKLYKRLNEMYKKLFAIMWSRYNYVGNNIIITGDDTHCSCLYVYLMEIDSCVEITKRTSYTKKKQINITWHIIKDKQTSLYSYLYEPYYNLVEDDSKFELIATETNTSVKPRLNKNFGAFDINVNLCFLERKIEEIYMIDQAELMEHEKQIQILEN